MDGRPERMASRRVLAAIAVLGVILAPSAGSAGPAQNAPTSQAAEAAPDSTPAIAIDMDVAYAKPREIADALDESLSGVSDQLAALEEAEATVRGAQAALEEAGEAVEATKKRIEGLVSLSDEVVADAFVSPPSQSALDAVSTSTMSEMVVKQRLLDIQSDDNADILEELEVARQDLAKQEARERELATQASEASAEAQAELASLESTTSQQAEFIMEVEKRLEHQVAEAEALESLDPEVAEELRADQAALAAKIREILEARELRKALEALAAAQRQADEEAAQRAAEQQAPPSSGGGAVDLGSASGSLADVACPGGGAITVDQTLADSLSAMLEAAAADGIVLCGKGYRDPQQQVELRRSNCGSSQYAIYEAPASACSPPTARPGTSMHEQGLAVDFTCGGSLISSQGSPCFVWLSNNAGSYGLYNLPSEPWHWSTDGT